MVDDMVTLVERTIRDAEAARARAVILCETAATLIETSRMQVDRVSLTGTRPVSAASVVSHHDAHAQSALERVEPVAH